LHSIHIKLHNPLICARLPAIPVLCILPCSCILYFVCNSHILYFLLHVVAFVISAIYTHI
jgi:hypothetical protein